ncbi:hypothetical protein BDV95DRAFT_321956 [Massariosphaeria phaeospora]|uniref:Extracellular membrane protein CFEM domain-containing protein n=1 Tax=Massariosphaeria phaeospora TaxID=100035 RepID=A0A7C8I9J9_9PLEO|nr:hypothetical protein BDV95DRAFT_321956 [Massariosphaeria phaeospora]
MRMCVTLLLLCVFASIATASDPIRIFIDQISEYHLLATCAELQLSTIVRNMAYVCGDGQKTTSYSCFCSASSAKVSSMIGKHVGTACVGDPAQSMSAIGVFDSYCQIGRSVQGQAGMIPTGYCGCLADLLSLIRYYHTVLAVFDCSSRLQPVDRSCHSNGVGCVGCDSGEISSRSHSSGD